MNNEEFDAQTREVFGEDYDRAMAIIATPPSEGERAEVERRLAQARTTLEYLVGCRMEQAEAAHEGDTEKSIRLSTITNLVLQSMPREDLVPILFYVMDVLAADAFVREGKDYLTTMPVSLDDLPPLD